MKSSFSAERMIEAPAEVVYHCIADYREHHRPDGFLPEAFSDIRIEHGGVGAGTELRWVVEVGGRPRPVNATVSEPVPGRTLLETGSGIETTFTVEPTIAGARVRLDTTFARGGLQGVMDRLFAARFLRPIYEEELRRLDEYARAHGPLGPGNSPTAGQASRRAVARLGPPTVLSELGAHPSVAPVSAERNAVLALGFIR
jgi:hypothetical protein